MYERNGYISVWGGDFDSETALFGYVEKEYRDDGTVRSGFLDDFPIGWYDEDFAEANYLNLTDIRESILAHSYGDSFVDAVSSDVMTKKNINSLYVIYDLDAHELASSRGRMFFLGAYPYKK